MNSFYLSEHVTLEEVLDNREKRAAFQYYLLNQYGGSLISFTCNIPGPVKNNSTVLSIFEKGKEMLFEKLELEQVEILVCKEWNQVTGPELFVSTVVDPFLVKEWCMEIEENKIGRLFDMDVLFKAEDNRLTSISREELNVAKRKCFICNNEAKICARSRKHDFQEIYSMIEELAKT